MDKKFDRKKFFGLVGKITAFTAVVSIIPSKNFSSKKIFDKKITVKEHPSAVKRENKV